jgi:hypothetical protein
MVTLRRRRRRDPVGVDSLLGRATRALAKGNDSVLAAVRAAWPDATGPGTVNHAYPIRRSRAGVVTVACADAVWAQELDMRTDELMERMAALLDNPDAVAGLRFVVADHAIPTPEEAPAPRVPLPPPDPAAVARARDATRAIEDPELRDLVTRAAARSLERGERP